MPRGVSRYDEARLQGRLWTPEQLKCDLWYDAADLSTITVATGVSEWRDKSGNANHAAQATGGSQPLFEADTTAGLPALRFDATNNKRLAVGTVRSYDTTAPACSLFSVTRLTSTRVVAFGGNDSSFFGEGSNFGLWRNTSDSGITTSSSYTSQIARWHLWSGVRTGTGSNGATMWLDGDTVANGTATLGGTFNIAFLGARFYAGSSFQPSVGWIGEAIAIPSAVSPRERQLVEGYLAHKWGIALRGDHPFHYRAPTLGD